MKKLLHGILSLALIIGLMPHGLHAATTSPETKFENDLFSITKPSSLTNWYVNDESSVITVQFVDDSDQELLNKRGGLIMNIAAVDDTEILWTTLFPPLLVSDFNCTKHEFITISDYKFEKFTCDSTETSSDNTLRNVTLSFGLVGDKYVGVFEDFGKDDMDKTLVQDLTKNLSFKLSNTDKSITNFTSSLNPKFSLTSHNNWKLFEVKSEDESAIFGVKNNTPFDTFLLQYYPNVSNIFQESNEEYFENLKIFGNSYGENTSITYDSIDYNYDLSPSLKNVLKYRSVTASTKNTDSLFKSYSMAYHVRNNFISDVRLSYNFLAKDDNEAQQKISQFENEIVKSMGVIPQEKEISYSDLNIDYSPGAPGLWDSGPDGNLISPQSSSAVYLVKSDGKRYVFPNEKVYYSWYNDFSNVEQVPDSDLAKYPIGGSISIRPGNMIKITTVPKVYIILDDNKIAWVESEAAAKRLVGDDWNKKIKDVPDALFTNYTEMNFSIK